MPRNTPKTLYIVRGLAALLGICALLPLHSATLPLELSRKCHLINEYYDRHVNGDGNAIRVNMVASSGLMKTLNDKVFGNRTGKTQYLVDAAHGLFEFRLLDALKDYPDIKIVARKAPIVKFFVFTLDLPRELADVVQEVTLKAKIGAIADLSRFLYQNDKVIAQRVLDMTGPDSPATRTNKFYFAEGRNFIIPMTAEDQKDFIPNLRQYFTSEKAFVDAMRRNYGVGLGANDADGHTNARLSILNPEKFGEVVKFEFHILKEQLEHAKSQKQDLGWFFKGGGEELNATFGLLRSNLDQEDPSKWGKDFVDLMNVRLRDAGKSTNEIDRIQAFLGLKTYIKTINLFEYLPEDSVTVNPLLRTEFEALKDPTGVLFLDIKKLGARNLMELHESVDTLLTELQQLENEFLDLKTIELAKGNNEFQLKKIDATYNRFLQKRLRILENTGRFIDSKVEQLRGVLERVGIERDDYRIWYSGDDVFVVYRNTQITPMPLATKIGDSELASTFRIGTMQIQKMGLPHLDLEYARFTVGRSAAALKVSEKFNFPYQVIVEYRFENGKDVAIFAKQDSETNGLTRLPTTDFQFIEAALDGEWIVKNYY
jgi:hypothetical protein